MNLLAYLLQSILFQAALLVAEARQGISKPLFDGNDRLLVHFAQVYLVFVVVLNECPVNALEHLLLNLLLPVHSILQRVVQALCSLVTLSSYVEA